MRVLLVEDDKSLAEFVRKGLKENGHAVDVAHNGDDGEAMASTEAYDVIVLDIMLPGQTGFEIVRSIRSANVSVPVLLLSARDGLNDRVTGLDLGADDYVTKPFAFDELLARLRALQRRSTGKGPGELRCGDLVVNPATRTVIRADRKIELTPKEFSLLEYLIRHAGSVVTRTSIIETVWDMNFDSMTNVVDVMVNRLRAKVDRPFDTPLLHTVRGVGYILQEPEEAQ